jgi:D-threo-aldose 1-dehydrogenase
VHALQSQRRSDAGSRPVKGVAVLNAAPYAGGVLAKGSSEYPRYVYREASDAALDPIRRIEAVCALQFAMRDPRITATICGVSKPKRVKQTLDWARFPIPAALWEELKAAPFSTDDPEPTGERRPG